MATVNVYLNFDKQCEEAFNFYQSAFGGEFIGGISRFGDIPPEEGAPAIPDDVAHQVMHMALPILGGSILMGSDAPAAFGMPPVMAGNNMHITISPDSREETDRLFAALSAGGEVTMEMQDTFWGSYYGMCTDPFSVCWMFDYTETPCPDKK